MTPHNTLHTNMSLIGYIHNWVYVFFKKKIGKVLPKFDLYKGFFLEKNDPNSPSFEERKIRFL
jgi:hypothetical protein